MTNLLRHRACFTLALLLFVLAMLLETARLGRVARFVPLIVTIPTLALLAFQLVLDLAPRYRRIYQKLERTKWPGLPGRERQGDRERESGQAASNNEGARGRLGWTLLLPVMIYGFGFFVAIPVHALVYLRRFSGERWSLSLAIPAGLGCLLLLLVRLAPDVPLWPGWIWMRLGLH
ncbi:MAG: hypothetical protein V1774_07455 [Candidatus Eisenbacteria bacterium]